MANKKKKLKDIIPVLWDQYQHIYSVRKSNIQNNINFLLIAVSFLPIISMTLYDIFDYELFLIPIIFQLLAFLVLLKSFFLKGSKIPWTDAKECINQLDTGEIYATFFSEIKAGENESYIEMKEMGKIIRCSLYLIVISLYCMLTAVMFYLLDGSLSLYSGTILLSIGAGLLLLYYQRQPNWVFDQDSLKIKQEVKKWLEDEKTPEKLK